MPVEQEELADIKGKLDMIESPRFKQYVKDNGVESQLVNKNVEALKKTRKNLVKAKHGLLTTRNTEKNKQKVKNVDRLLDVIDDVIKPQDVDTSSNEDQLIEEQQPVAPACGNLFDPCTREPVASIEALERRVREIKKQRDATPVGLYGLTSKTSNYEFLEKVFLNKDIELDDMVSFKLADERLPGTDIYEVLSRLFVFFGGVKEIGRLGKGGDYKFMDRAESGGRVFDDAKSALRKIECLASKGSGVSDITVVNVTQPAADEQKESPSYCESPCKQPPPNKTKTYVMSVKWRQKERNAEKLDLEKLRVLALDATTEDKRPVNICVFVKSKKDQMMANSKMARQYVQYLSKTYFGYNEDVKPFLQEKRFEIFDAAAKQHKTPLQILEENYFEESDKGNLKLQLHQEIIVTALCDSIDTSTNKTYLIGVLPRGGKTFIAGGIMREYLNRKKIKNLNVFWITAAVNETQSQVEDELINLFKDFDEFNFVAVRDDEDVPSATRGAKPHTVYFCSSQLLLTQKKQSKKRREFLDNLLSGENKIGLVFFDEAHKTGTGEQTKEQIQTIMTTYSALDLPFIFLTATYYNILFDFEIQSENRFIWDYSDVLSARRLGTDLDKDLAIEGLRRRFNTSDPTLVDKIIKSRLDNKDTYESMAKAYIGFPDLHFISADFQTEALERFAEQSAYNEAAGFSLGAIFAIKPTSTITDVKTSDGRIKKTAYKIFNNLTNVRNIISLLTKEGSFNDDAEQEGGEPLKKERNGLEPTILGRINKMSSDSDSRFRLDELPTMLMFMPTGGEGTNIFRLLCAWSTLLMTHSWWGANYEVACIVSEENLTEDERTLVLEREKEQDVQDVSDHAASNIHIYSKEPKRNILALEKALHCPAQGKKRKGLVILAGEKLSMGISLPCTDVVFLFNEKKTPDDIIQKMYRALTPSPNKKSAFVVDLNPVRTLSAVYGYTKAAHQNVTPATSDLLDIVYDTYSWDIDQFEYSLAKNDNSKPLLFQDKLKELFNKAERDDAYKIHEDMSGLNRRLASNIKKGMDASFKTKIKGHISTDKLDKLPGKIGLEGSTITLRKGKLVIRKKKEGADESSNEDSGDDSDAEEIVIENFIETISDFVKYLAITSTKPNLEEALAEYSEDKENDNATTLRQNVLKLVKARGQITKGEDKDVQLSKLMIEAVKDFALNTSKMVFTQTRSEVTERSIRKDKILARINKRLTPRQKQKKDSGEVFTPIEFIEDMLSHLPKTVWSNPKLKWLDPANGIGNFPVVIFYKLDEGLKSLGEDKELGINFSNEQQRRKYIIENMLFMLELQSNNSRVARNIFKSLCDDCEPKIITTDSLKITAEELASNGFPDKYDIIIGNPPFNSGGLLKGGGTLWPDFVKKAFELVAVDGYICFVHPPGWRKFYAAGDRDNQGKLWHTIREKGWNLDYVNVSDQPPKHFPIVDYYVIHAKKTNNVTKYDSTFMGTTDSGETLLDYPFIPNMINSETMSILKKLFDAKGDPINIVRNQKFQPSKEDEGKSGTPHYHFTDKSGKKHIYNKQYETIPEYINKEKVLLTFSNGYEKGRLFAFYSDDNYGTTGSTMYMLTKSKPHGDKLVKFFNSDIITFLMKITQYSASPNHKNEFKILNQLQVPDSLDYDLTEEEKALIKKIVHKPDDSAARGRALTRRFTRKIRRA